MMNELHEKILKELEKTAPLSVEVLSEQLSFTDSQSFKELVKAVAFLEQTGEIEMTNDGRLKLPQKEVQLEGIFRSHERGFGFVTIDEDEPDVFIPKGKTCQAMNGDQVMIDITAKANPWKEKAAEGKVLEIIHHAVTQVVGIFTKNKFPVSEAIGYVTPSDKKLRNQDIIIEDKGIIPEEGSVCVVEIIQYPTAKEGMKGIVVETLGHKDDPGVDILSIVIANGINPVFPEEVLDEAEKIPEALDEDHLESDRVDLRNELIITIDGDNTKDFDDAVNVKRLSNGHFELGVHIADVAHYVKEGGALDKEAFERGTSVYLTDRVIPMLPRRLSNGICSLNPKVARYTLSCVMEINDRGQCEDYRIFKSVIKTCERMTYRDVNTLLAHEDDSLEERYHILIPMLEEMKQLHLCLEKMRQKRGAISFEDNEASIQVDASGKPIDIVLRQRGLSEKMIESFMLMANETIAHHFRKQKLPFIYRVHEHPDEKKMQRFFEFMTHFGISIRGTKDEVSPKVLQKVLRDVEGKQEEAVVNTMLLRSMQQAKYDIHPLGHYGLAATDYTHFTSPIRRYPDLIVHRLIHAYADGEKNEVKRHFSPLLEEISSHSSKMERRAVEAERETDAMKKAEFMQPFVGQTFKGVISSVVKFGLFVELSNTVEGLVHINTMDDYFEFNEQHLMLIGKRSNTVFTIGQEIEVKLVKADPKTREIDFVLASPLKVKQKQKTIEHKGVDKKHKKKRKKKAPFYKGAKKARRKGGRRHA